MHRSRPRSARPRSSEFESKHSAAISHRQTFLAIAIAIFLIAGTFVLYLPVRTHEFISFDDPDYVTANAQVRQGLSWEGVGWALFSTEAANWHPLTWISHMADVSLFGAQPTSAGWHHLSAVAWHALASTLLFAALQSMTGRVWPSTLVAALFAFHPLHVESVAWVAERKDQLSACFAFLTLWAYACYAKRTESYPRYALVCVCYLLGLTAKSMLVTLPMVLLLLDYWPLARLPRDGNWAARRRAVWPLVREKIPLFALAALASGLTMFAQSAGGAVSSLNKLPFGRRMANAIISYALYLRDSVWPADLCFFYPYDGQPLNWSMLLTSLALLIGISVLAFRARRTCPALMIGWLWYLGMLVPVIGLVQVGMQSRADRYTYLPLVGIWIGLAWGLDFCIAHWPRVKPLIATGAVLVVVACFVVTQWQIGYWQDDVSLFGRAVEVTENNALARVNLGAALMGRGQLEEASVQFETALAIQPLAEAHSGMSTVLAARGDLAGAISESRLALSKTEQRSRGANNLAWLLATAADAKLRRPDEAVDLANEAVKEHSQNPEYLDTLAVAQAAAGQFDAAVATLDRAIDLARRQHLNAIMPILTERRQQFLQKSPYVDLGPKR